jgi:hypothetical protein
MLLVVSFPTTPVLMVYKKCAAVAKHGILRESALDDWLEGKRLSKVAEYDDSPDEHGHRNH